MFDQKGHLTKEAITALVQGEALSERERLEAAEHLSFCDLCLQRYTEALSGNLLLTPEVSCADTIWWRIRQRTVRVLTSRYATAAAAVALALTLVWADIPLPERTINVEEPTMMEKVEDLMTGVNDFFNGLELPGIGGKMR